MSQQLAASQAGGLLVQDYLQNGSESAYCQYLEFQQGTPFGSLNPLLSSAFQRLCLPPGEPLPPPSQEFTSGGGDSCRLYQVTVATGSVGSAPNIGTTNTRGPVRLVKRATYDTSGNRQETYYLLGGDGINCPITSETLAGTSNVEFSPIFCYLVNVVALEGDPEIDTPVPIVNPTPNPNPLPPFGFTANIDLGGVNVSVPINFEPPVVNVVGVVIPFIVAPTANFNLDVDPTINLNPRFGIDLDLNVVIPLNPGTGNPVPAPGEDPVPTPGGDQVGQGECTDVDYDRIKGLIEDASCCKPIGTPTIQGVFTFAETDDVYRLNLPSNTALVSVSIAPDNNSRRYKLAGSDSEIALGNMTITSDGSGIAYTKVWLLNQTMMIPENLPAPGVRISLKQGCTVTVRAATYAV